MPKRSFKTTNKNKLLRSASGKNWSTYLIQGILYDRIAFGNEEDFDVRDSQLTCPCCSSRVLGLHLLGCKYEQSICPKHPGRMIDCPCDTNGED